MTDSVKLKLYQMWTWLQRELKETGKAKSHHKQAKCLTMLSPGIGRVLTNSHYQTRAPCQVTNTHGKTLLAKKSDGEAIFAECLFSGTRQSLCCEPEATRQISWTMD